MPQTDPAPQAPQPATDAPSAETPAVSPEPPKPGPEEIAADDAGATAMAERMGKGAAPKP